MILKGWHLESYGIFSDWTLDELESGITVLHGPNEAGKSTLLHFIRGVLFGYPTKSQEGYVPNLGGGNHGGRLFIADDAEGGTASTSAGHWTLERWVKQNKRHTLLRPDGTLAEDLELEGLLHHADKTLFKSVFTFELSDLVALEGKDAEKVRDRLFSAGISGAGKSASELGALLKGEMDGLYKKKGSTQRLNILLAELDTLEATRKELVAKAKNYPVQKGTLDELSTQAVSLQKERSEAASEAERLALLGKLWPLLNERGELEKEIAGLQAPATFPVGGVVRMEAQLEKINLANQELDKLEHRQSTLKAQLDALNVDEGLVGAAHDAEKLQETLSLQQNRLDRYLKAEREVEIAHADFHQTLEELGKWWDAEKVDAVDIGPERQAAVKALQDKLYGTAQELEFAKRSGETVPEKATAHPVQGMALLAVAALLALVPLLPSVAPDSVGPLLWAGAAVVAALGLWRFKATTKNVSPPTQPGSESAKEAFEKLSAQWQDSLKGWGLTEGSSTPPETVLHLMAELRSAKKELAELGKKELHKETLGEEIARWEADARERLRAESSTANSRATAEKLLDEVQDFIRAVLGEIKTKERADKLRAELDDVNTGFAEPRKTKATAESDLAELFEAAGASDAEAYRQRGEQFERNKELGQKLTTLKAQLTTLTGDGEEAVALLEEAHTGQMEQWRNGYREASERHAALEEELGEVNRRLGALEQELGELENSTLLAECQAQMEALRTEAQGLARKWRVAALTRALVRTTLDEYTAENQPEALERASELFTALTGGRYLRVVQSSDNVQLLVTRPDGAQLGAHQLSRGTREGLYICLRLALAGQYAKRRGRLPLVMDDVLVNLDPQRAEATLKALALFAKDSQVLFFTCHPETVERIKRVDKTAKVLKL